MRYIEFVYLTLAGMSFTFFVTEYDRLEGRQMIFVLLAMGIFAFMFAFRRKQRLAFERLEQAEMDKLEAELADWAEEQEQARQAGPANQQEPS